MISISELREALLGPCRHPAAPSPAASGGRGRQDFSADVSGRTGEKIRRATCSNAEGWTAG